MFNNKHFKTVEIILSSGGLSTSKREFSNCSLTVNENYLIISNYEKVEKLGDPQERLHQVFKMSEIIKFKTVAHNITNIKTTKNDS
jgi:hypothetical protein